MAFGGIGVHLSAGDGVLLGDLLARDAHVEVVVDVPESVVHDGIDELAVSEPESLAKPRE